MRALSMIALGGAIFLFAGQASAVTIISEEELVADLSSRFDDLPPGTHVELTDAISHAQQDSMVTADGTGLFITGLSGPGSAASGEIDKSESATAQSVLTVEFTADAAGDSFQGSFGGDTVAGFATTFLLYDETAGTIYDNLRTSTTFSGSLTGGDSYLLQVGTSSLASVGSGSWELSFSATNNAASAPAPEPGTCLLALATAGMAAIRRRRAA